MLVNAKRVPGCGLLGSKFHCPVYGFPPSTLVVATAQAPYAIIVSIVTLGVAMAVQAGRHWGPAAGLEADEKIITTWWSSKT